MSENGTDKSKNELTAKKIFIWGSIILLVLITLFCLACYLVGSQFLQAITLVHGKPVETVMPAYGQLGDAVGGVLNPLLGFATVCLLIWSITVQTSELRASRAELELSRDQITLSRIEAERSANALTAQVELSQKEYDRKQLESAAEHYIVKNEQYFNAKLCWLGEYGQSGRLVTTQVRPAPFSFDEVLLEFKIGVTTNKTEKLKEVSEGRDQKGADLATSIHILRTHNNLVDLVYCVAQLGRSDITIPALGEYWKLRVEELLEAHHSIQILTTQRREELAVMLENSFRTS